MKIRCVIIDDEPLAAEVVSNYLKEFSNMKLMGSFTNPLEALGMVESGEVDVVFIDINMPKMNGLEFIKKVRANPVYDSMKLMMVTSHNSMEDMSEAIQKGSDDFLMKPFTQDMVADKLRILGFAN